MPRNTTTYVNILGEFDDATGIVIVGPFANDAEAEAWARNRLLGKGMPDHEWLLSYGDNVDRFTPEGYVSEFWPPCVDGDDDAPEPQPGS